MSFDPHHFEGSMPIKYIITQRGKSYLYKDVIALLLSSKFILRASHLPGVGLSARDVVEDTVPAFKLPWSNLQILGKQMP